MKDIESVFFDLAPGLLDGSQPTSTRLMIKCPYHKGGKEKTPSCAVSRIKPVFYCHGCGESGHVRRILIEKVGLNKELVESLVGGIEFSEGSGRSYNKMFALYRGGDSFKSPWSLSEDVLDPYLLKPMDLADQFDERTLLHFEVGYDVDNWRIIFPLRDIYGTLVGVSGRTTVGEEPRYRIYKKDLIELWDLPEDYSLDEVKDSLLWHAHICYPFIFNSSSTIILCEGFKACMWTWQCGYQNVVALVGSHLSKKQHELIARTGSDVVLFLDNNEAGVIGSYKAYKLLSKTNRTYFAQYPDIRQQPDDLTPLELTTSIERPHRFATWKREIGSYGIHERAKQRQHQRW